MNARITTLALALTALTTAVPAYAGNPIAELADATGLSKRQVQMIVSNRTPYAEYRTSYSRSLAQFKRVLGKERAEKVIAGETVMLDRRQDARVATLDQRHDSERTP